jgi:hypothetical protein
MEEVEMYPNPNDWLLVKAMDDARLSRTRNQHQSRRSIVDWSLDTRTDTELFSRFWHWIESIRLKLRPVEECGCLDCCPSASIPAI